MISVHNKTDDVARTGINTYRTFAARQQTKAPVGVAPGSEFPDAVFARPHAMAAYRGYQPPVHFVQKESVRLAYGDTDTDKAKEEAGKAMPMNIQKALAKLKESHRDAVTHANASAGQIQAMHDQIKKDSVALLATVTTSGDANIPVLNEIMNRLEDDKVERSKKMIDDQIHQDKQTGAMLLALKEVSASLSLLSGEGGPKIEESDGSDKPVLPPSAAVPEPPKPEKVKFKDLPKRDSMKNKPKGFKFWVLKGGKFTAYESGGNSDYRSLDSIKVGHPEREDLDREIKRAKEATDEDIKAMFEAGKIVVSGDNDAAFYRDLKKKYGK